METSYSFPVYRKYPNGRSFFKILSLDEFLELTIVGSKLIQHNIKASIYPDKIRIVDMLEMKDDMWLDSNEQEFNSILNQYKQ